MIAKQMELPVRADQRSSPRRHRGLSASEWSAFAAVPDLGLQALHAHYTKHEYDRHWHDFYVIGAVDRGAATFSLRGQRIIAPARTAMIINPGDAHDGKPLGPEGYEYSMLYIDECVIRRLAEELGSRASFVALEQPIVDDQRTIGLIRRLNRAVIRNRNRAECDVRLVDLMRHLLARFASMRAHSLEDKSVDRRILRVRDFIHAHFAEPITTQSLAKASGLGRARLNELFRKAYGIPLHGYLNSVRMSEARNLLRTGLPSAEVALTVGLADQSHLIRRFKASAGVTPGEFRSGYHTNVQY